MQLAQLNIAEALAEMDDPLMQEFVENLEHINRLAEESPGFVWRLQDEEGDATSIRVFDNPNIIANLSLWRSVEELKAFVFETEHLYFLRNKKKWMHKLGDAHLVMWWVPNGHIPTMEEAKARLDYLRARGNTEYAFNFRGVVPDPDSQLAMCRDECIDECFNGL